MGCNRTITPLSIAETILKHWNELNLYKKIDVIDFQHKANEFYNLYHDIIPMERVSFHWDYFGSIVVKLYWMFAYPHLLYSLSRISTHLINEFKMLSWNVTESNDINIIGKILLTLAYKSERLIKFKETDIKILRLLQNPHFRPIVKGKPSLKRIAAKLKVDNATVQRRYAILNNTQVIAFLYVINPAKLGFITLLWIHKKPLPKPLLKFSRWTYKLNDTFHGKNHFNSTKSTLYFTIFHVPYVNIKIVMKKLNKIGNLTIQLKKHKWFWNLKQLKDWKQKSWEKIPLFDGKNSTPRPLWTELPLKADPQPITQAELKMLKHISHPAVISGHYEHLGRDLNRSTTWIVDQITSLLDKKVIHPVYLFQKIKLPNRLICLAVGKSAGITSLTEKLSLLPNMICFSNKNCLVNVSMIPDAWISSVDMMLRDFLSEAQDELKLFYYQIRAPHIGYHYNFDISSINVTYSPSGEYRWEPFDVLIDELGKVE